LENFNLQVFLTNESEQLTGNIPKELGSLKNLQVLNLANNQLTGKIPVELGNLTNLNWLNLSFNQLSGNIPVKLGNLNNLFELFLHENKLKGEIPTELGNINYLTRVNLGFNQLTGSIPIELANPTAFSEFFLSGNLLTGTIPAELGKLTNLKILSLNENELTGTIPHELGNLTNIIGMHLSYNQLSGCYPNSFTLFCDVPFSFSNEKISDGNQFDAEWEDFCTNNDGACVPNSTDSYDQTEIVNFTYDHLSQTLHITSSNLPVENITLYGTNGQLSKNYKLNTFNNTKISLTGLPTGLYVVVATVKGKLYKANYYKITI